MKYTPFKILQTDRIVNEPFCRIDKQKVQFPDNSLGDWFVHVSNNAVIVLPLLSDGKILLQNNYKHGGGKVVTEFCAGVIDDGETPEQAAQRELSEETGFAAESFEIIGKTLANPTSSPMEYFFVVAKNCTKVHQPHQEPAEQIEVFVADSVAEAEQKILHGDYISSSASVAGVSFLKKYLSA